MPKDFFVFEHDGMWAIITVSRDKLSLALSDDMDEIIESGYVHDKNLRWNDGDEWKLKVRKHNHRNAF